MGPTPSRSAVPTGIAPTGASSRRTAAVLAPPAAAALAVVVLSPPALVSAVLMAAGLVGAAVVLSVLVVAPLRSAIARERRHATELEVTLLTERAARDVEDRLDRALPLTVAEPETLRTGLRAVGELLGDREVSLLLQVLGEARVGWQLQLDDGVLRDARPVPGTPGCVALGTGATATTARSSALDACGHLQDQEVDGSAICVPLRAADEVLGVICVQGPPGELPSADDRARLDRVAHRVGARVAEQRRSDGPAGTGRPDPLTGLPTRPAMRDHLRRQVRSLAPFCVAVLDIDHHDDLPTDAAADASLRTLADVLCATLRPDDFICRLDGARFAAVLHGCTTDQATAALERARESLVLTLAASPDEQQVTFSAGVVASQHATSLGQIVALAEAACERAAVAGGNRVAAAT